MNAHTARLLRRLRRATSIAGLTGLLLPAVACGQAAPAAAPGQAAATSAPAATSTPAQVEALDAFVQRSMQTRQFPAAAVAVIKDGTIVVAKGYGLSDVEKGIKATEQTVFQLASVTKQFTAAAVLMLVEDGKVSLDAKVTDMLPGLPAAWNPVTVRHLLTHTSGIPSYTDTFRVNKVTDSRVFTPDGILALVKDAPLQFTPGERFAYCNTGYYLLGMVIEKASGKPYGTFVTERIFTPLGMTSSGYDDYGDARPMRAKGYNTANGQTTPAEHTHPSQPFAAGALVSTVVDLAKWDAALGARKLLKPASYDAMWTPMRLNDGSPSTYAMGWVVEPYRGRPRQAHGGGITGFSTFIARFPDDRITIVALVNQGGGAAGPLVDGIADIYVPGVKEAGPKPLADTDAKTTAFVKEVITLAAKGETKAEWLTPDFQAFMLPERIKQGPQMMGRHGPLNGFDLMEESTRDGARFRVYRATFGTTAMRVQVVLSPEGKIAGLGISPLN
jgi:D-alanyl-D-alanine carboxypeptidase